MTVDGIRYYCKKCHGAFHEVEIWENDLCYACYKEDKK